MGANAAAVHGDWDQVSFSLDYILGPAADGNRTARACKERYELLASEGRVGEGSSGRTERANDGGSGGVGQKHELAGGSEVNPSVIVGKKLKRNSEAYQKKAGGAARKAAPGTPGLAGPTGN